MLNQCLDLLLHIPKRNYENMLPPLSRNFYREVSPLTTIDQNLTLNTTDCKEILLKNLIIIDVRSLLFTQNLLFISQGMIL